MSNHPSNPQGNTDLAHLRPAPNDEIDLGELLRKLLAEWKLISLITVIGAIAGVSYALTATPVFKVEAIVSEPTVAQLGNTTEQSLIPISQGSAFRRAVNEASKVNLQRTAFAESALSDQLEEKAGAEYDPNQAFAGVRNSLTIKKLVYDYNETSGDQVAPLRDIRIAFETPYPAAGTSFINSLIETANSQALKDFSSDARKVREEKIKELNQQLTSLTNSAVETRQAKIQRMVEANELQVTKLEQRMTTLLENARQDRLAQIQRMEEANALKISEIEQLLQTKLENARQDRLNRIALLNEALKTAERLSIVEPVTWDDLRPNQRQSQITNQLGETTASSPLYFQGTRILSAEINRLESREDDRPFISDYNQLKQQITDLKNDPKIIALKNRQDDRPFIDEYNQIAQQIENLKNDPEIDALRNRSNDSIYVESFDDLKRELSATQNELTSFDNAQFSQATLEPTVPANPIKPNKKLIVVAATVLAGFAGLFFALIRIAVRKEPEPA